MSRVCVQGLRSGFVCRVCGQGLCSGFAVRVGVQGSARLRAQMSGGADSLVTIARTLGLKGLYRGVDMTACRDIPSGAIFFALFSVGARRAPSGPCFLPPGPPLWCAIFVSLLSGGASRSVAAPKPPPFPSSPSGRPLPFDSI